MHMKLDPRAIVSALFRLAPPPVNQRCLTFFFGYGLLDPYVQGWDMR